MGEGPQDNTQLTELVVTASCDQVDVLRKTKFLIKCHPKVTNSKRKGNMGEGLGQQVLVNTSQLSATTKPNELGCLVRRPFNGMAVLRRHINCRNYYYYYY